MQATVEMIHELRAAQRRHFAITLGTIVLSSAMVLGGWYVNRLAIEDIERRLESAERP